MLYRFGLCLFTLLLLVGPALAQDEPDSLTLPPPDSLAADSTFVLDTAADSLAAEASNALPAPIHATDLLKIRQLDDVTVSPDGRYVAYTVRSVIEGEEPETYAYRTHLYLVPTNGREQPRQLTRGPSASQPAWHPGGERIAFVREVDGTPQIFTLSLLGGEAVQLTDFEHGASRPRWSPDGEWLLFASSLPEEAVRTRTGAGPRWPSERPGRTPSDTAGAPPDPNGSLAEVRAWLDRNEADENPRVFTRLDLQDETGLEPSLTFRHFFVQRAEAGAEPVAITSGFYDHADAVWLPNGEQILFSTALVDDRHPDRVRDSDLFIVDPDGSRRTRLLDLEGYRVHTPLPSPDGRFVAFLAESLDDPGYAQTEIGLLALDGQTPTELLTLDFDRDPSQVRWSPDNRFLYFVAASDGGFPLYRFPALEGRPAEPTTREAGLLSATVAADEIAFRTAAIDTLTTTYTGIRSYDVTIGGVYYVVTHPANPYELFTNNVAFTRERRLSMHNATWLADKAISLPEQHTLERDSTLRLDYWVIPPTFVEDGETYPLLVAIHGGPAAMWGPGEATMWHEFQYFASRGYGIVYTNPRGSGGYGHAFKRANYQDWGLGPASDVLAVATEAARLPWVDSDRQVITGGSYAGYLTAWILAHDHRFRAGVAQRGVYDLGTFLGEGQAWRLVPYHFGGYPWDTDPLPPDTSSTADGPALLVGGLDSTRTVREILAANSPLTYVDQIQTPLLILHGDADRRTGFVQSEALYKSLKILERPVEYVRYPGAQHDLSRTGDPRQRIDRILRIYEFFERFVE